jgi:hypothetical protein
MDMGEVAGVGLYGVWILGSLWCVASLGWFIYLAIRGDDPMLLSLSSPARFSWKQKAFLLAAGLAFLIAMHQGGKAFMAWIPESWGTIDEDGDFRTYQEVIGGALGVMGGLFLIYFIQHALPRELGLKVAVAQIELMKRIYEATSIQQLTEIAMELEIKRREQGKCLPMWVSEEPPVSEQRQFMILYDRMRRLVAERIARLEEVRKSIV